MPTILMHSVGHPDKIISTNKKISVPTLFYEKVWGDEYINSV